LCDLISVFFASIFFIYTRFQNGTKRFRQDGQISSAIAEAFEESGARFGAERIRVQLEKRGIRTSKKRIIKLMKNMGLYNKSPERPYYPSSNSDRPEVVYDVQILQ
jgi:hypothetical protein